jgi:hypothetical protein
MNPEMSPDAIPLPGGPYTKDQIIGALQAIMSAHAPHTSFHHGARNALEHGKRRIASRETYNTYGELAGPYVKDKMIDEILNALLLKPYAPTHAHPVGSAPDPATSAVGFPRSMFPAPPFSPAAHGHHIPGGPSLLPPQFYGPGYGGPGLISQGPAYHWAVPLGWGGEQPHGAPREYLPQNADSPGFPNREAGKGSSSLSGLSQRDPPPSTYSTQSSEGGNPPITIDDDDDVALLMALLVLKEATLFGSSGWFPKMDGVPQPPAEPEPGNGDDQVGLTGFYLNRDYLFFLIEQVHVELQKMNLLSPGAPQRQDFELLKMMKTRKWCETYDDGTGKRGKKHYVRLCPTGIIAASRLTGLPSKAAFRDAVEDIVGKASTFWRNIWTKGDGMPPPTSDYHPRNDLDIERQPNKRQRVDEFDEPFRRLAGLQTIATRRGPGCTCPCSCSSATSTTSTSTTTTTTTTAPAAPAPAAAPAAPAAPAPAAAPAAPAATTAAWATTTAPAAPAATTTTPAIGGEYNGDYSNFGHVVHVHGNHCTIFLICPPSTGSPSRAGRASPARKRAPTAKFSS